MRTYLVAVVAPSEADVQKFLLASPYGPGSEGGPDAARIDSWWIAEDDRRDGSDLDSAVFVPRGAQADVAELIRQWIESNADRWNEEGYPYADTDVSGAWFRPDAKEGEWLG